jgi:hypothetical protein
MMRRPTPLFVLLDWHTRALAAVRSGFPVPDVSWDEPQCGWFRCRMVARGPWCPGRIWMRQITDALGELTEPEELQAEVLGRRWDVRTAWERLSGGEPVTEAEFLRLTREHLTNPIYRATHAPVDFSRTEATT